MIKTLMPLCLGTSGSVRTKARMKSASWAPEVHTFWPLTTKWSPSSWARVRRPARSEPASGSDMPSAAVMSPRSSGTAHFCFWASVPNPSSEGPMMVRPWGFWVTSMPRLVSSSWWTNCSTRVALRPPYSGGLPGTSHPASNSFRCQSRAHWGAWALESDGSVTSDGSGALASSQAANSARKASVSASKASFIGQPPRSRPPQRAIGRSRCGPPGPGGPWSCRTAARRPWPASRRAARRSPTCSRARRRAGCRAWR